MLTDPGVDSGPDDDDDQVVRAGTCVYFYATVSPASVLKLVRLLEEAAVEALTTRVSHVILFLHTWGGCAFAGFSAYDHIRRCRVPVYCIADGFVASAGTFLLLGGARRFMHRHCSLLIHQLSTGMQGKLAELAEEFKNSKFVMRLIVRLYAERTNLPRGRLRALLKRETMLSFDRALEHGFIEGEPPIPMPRAPDDGFPAAPRPPRPSHSWGARADGDASSSTSVEEVALPSSQPPVPPLNTHIRFP